MKNLKSVSLAILLLSMESNSSELTPTQGIDTVAEAEEICLQNFLTRSTIFIERLVVKNFYKQEISQCIRVKLTDRDIKVRDATYIADQLGDLRFRESQSVAKQKVVKSASDGNSLEIGLPLDMQVMKASESESDINIRTADGYISIKRD